MFRVLFAAFAFSYLLFHTFFDVHLLLLLEFNIYKSVLYVNLLIVCLHVFLSVVHCAANLKCIYIFIFLNTYNYFSFISYNSILPFQWQFFLSFLYFIFIYIFGFGYKVCCCCCWFLFFFSFYVVLVYAITQTVKYVFVSRYRMSVFSILYFQHVYVSLLVFELRVFFCCCSIAVVVVGTQFLDSICKTTMCNRSKQSRVEMVFTIVARMVDRTV